MTKLTLDPPSAFLADAPALDMIREALQESRQRWRHLVGLAADIAFETDAKGRFVFVIPDTALGWPSGALVGQPSEFLLADDDTHSTFNPFRPAHEIKRRRSWIRRYDGTLAMLTLSTAPLHDDAGEICGARGIGIDISEYDNQSSRIAGQLRRGEVLDHVLARIGQEPDAGRMMDAALWTLVHALGAEGAAVIASLAEGAPLELIHECGPGAEAVLEVAVRHVTEHPAGAVPVINLDGRPVLVAGCQNRFGVKAGLAIWRNANSRSWDCDDTMLAISTSSIVRMILDYEVIHKEMAQQARTDLLTGLLNRRAFLEQISRHLGRLDREASSGTLLAINVDGLKRVNEDLGHATGDAMLTCVADMLRQLVRPSDLVARLDSNEFALWLNGADHMTAAERADYLCRSAPAVLQAVVPVELKGLGLSIGIATRRAGSAEPIEDMIQRADVVMHEVKRSGRGHWRVSLLKGDA